MTPTGITGFGAYIPRLRIDRKLIADVHEWMAPSLRGAAKGCRAFCSWDEDAVTMAVEAARDCMPPEMRGDIAAISLASTTLPYADLQHSAIVAGALQLKENVQSGDIAHSQRAGTSALLNLLQIGKRGLCIAAERPIAKPASTQELSFGAGAAAFTVGCDNLIAEFLGAATVTAQFVDHFRAAGDPYDYAWEERWVREEGLLKLLPHAARLALEDACLAIADVDRLIVPPVQRGAAQAVAKTLSYEGILADELTLDCGFTGTAHALLMLARVLEEAGPDEVILLLGFGQGADALVLRTTDKLHTAQPARGVAGSLADRVQTDSYLRLLSFYDNINLEWGMRAERDAKTMLSTQYRAADQLASFNAGQCRDCGTVQFPQLQYCVNTECRAPSSRFDHLSLADQPSKVFTFTNDWLFYYPAPPLRVGFIQFDSGARLPMEMVDAGDQGVAVGMPMRQVFRIKDIDRERGYRRYFWKATPITAGGK